MSLFDTRHIKPMLIGEEGPAFDDPEWLFELKLDGERAIVYLDKQGTELRNKRDRNMLQVFPELSDIHKQVKKRCILDGEYVVMKEGKPSFFDVQRRSLMSNSFRIKLAAESLPASFVAFDILNYDGKDVYTLPLMERKALLQKAITDSERMAVSRYLETGGLQLYAITEAQGLEGIVAKRKASQYFLGKRTKDWIKCKNLEDDDFVICGYVIKSEFMASLILGQYQGSQLLYTGSVPIGTNTGNFEKVRKIPKASKPVSMNKEDAVWIEPSLVCVVQFMERSSKGGMRQPVFKALRYDKTPEECKIKEAT